MMVMVAITIKTQNDAHRLLSLANATATHAQNATVMTPAHACGSTGRESCEVVQRVEPKKMSCGQPIAMF